MGCCGSSDASARAIFDAESQKRCTSPEYRNWVELLSNDLGGDRMAIPRDYPRMQVEVILNDAPLDCLSPKTGAINQDKRYEELRIRTRQICMVCGEGHGPVGQALESAWDELLKSEPALFEQPDANTVVQRVLTIAGILPPAKSSVTSPTSTNNNTAETNETVGAPSSSSSSTSVTWNVLVALTQGVVFFPVQRLFFLLWFPWMTRMMDVHWMSVVSRNENTFPEHVLVVHAQQFSNYVAPEDVHRTPRFHIATELQITLDYHSGQFVTAVLQVVRASVAPVVSGFGCSGEDKALWKLRKAALAARLRDVFEVDLDEVSEAEWKLKVRSA